MPQKTWAVGEETLAADFNLYVQSQVVAQFASVAARDAWTSPANGALCVTTDTNTVWQYIGGVWVWVVGPRSGIQWQRAATLSVPNAAYTNVPFDVQAFPAAGTPWGAVGQTATVPAGAAGLYHITFELNFAVAAIGNAAAARVVAGGHVYQTAGVPASNSGSVSVGAAAVPLSAGHTIVCAALQTSGVAVNATGYLFVTRAGPLT